MPASLPGSTLAENLANPSAGRQVLFELLSGPKGSPFDRDVQVPYLGSPGGAGFAASGNASTGGMSTGLGFGSPPIIGLTAPASIVAAGYTDDYIPGLTNPSGVGGNSTMMYIGGGRSAADGTSNPYTLGGWHIGGAGNGGSRDAGAGPAFTGFPIKMVTATGAVANGAAIETGFVNRSGIAMVTGQSTFGSQTAASGVAS